MRRLIFTIILSVSGSISLAADYRLEYAIFLQESGGKANCPDGKAGEIGPLQIRYACWKDSQVPGRYEDCRDLEYALKVFRAYTARAVGREDKARHWNGGAGHGRATDKYWKDVKWKLKFG